MPEQIVFAPLGATVKPAVTTTTGNVAITSNTSGYSTVLRIFNLTGSATAFINVGTSAVTATTAAGIPLVAGDTLYIRVNQANTHVAAITAATTATLYVTTGRD